MTSSADVSGPLAGLTVLDFTRVFSGPYATLLLADLGARVIKVEHPDGGDDSRAYGPRVDGTSGYFEALNRGKASIAVDAQTADGQALLRRLACRVDVVVVNFRPGRMASLGLALTLGVTFCMIAALVMLPALLRWFDERKLRAPAKAKQVNARERIASLRLNQSIGKHLSTEVVHLDECEKVRPVLH